MILEINGRLEIGRKFFSSLGSRLGFLRRGHITALLKAWGNKPELRDEFISAVSEGRRQSSISSRSGVGMGSREQVLGADFVITSLTIASVTGSNMDRVIPGNAETAWESNSFLIFMRHIYTKYPNYD